MSEKPVTNKWSINYIDVIITWFLIGLITLAYQLFQNVYLSNKNDQLNWLIGTILLLVFITAALAYVAKYTHYKLMLQH